MCAFSSGIQFQLHWVHLPNATILLGQGLLAPSVAIENTTPEFPTAGPSAAALYSYFENLYGRKDFIRHPGWE